MLIAEVKKVYGVNKVYKVTNNKPPTTNLKQLKWH
jgi:hypothetical protein